MRILITGISGDIGAGMSLIIRDMYPHAYILGVDMCLTNPKLNAANELLQVCRADDHSFITMFSRLCDGFDVIIPSVEAELSILASTEELDHFPLVKLSNDWLTRFLSKSETAWWLQSHQLPAPKTTMLEECQKGDLPIVIKPDLGQGSKNILIVNTYEELVKYQQDFSDTKMVAQKMVGDNQNEYTCAVIRCNSITRIFVMHRELHHGATKKIEVKHIPAIDEVLEKIAIEMNLQGVINVQLRLTDNGPQIFEINPRFSGTLVMRHKLGFQDLFWTIEYLLNNKNLPSAEIPYGAKVIRVDNWHDYKITLPN